jgi:hypothetical protein
MAEESVNKQWRGTPLEMDRGMDPYGIKEIVLEFDTGGRRSCGPSCARSSAPTSCWRRRTTSTRVSCAASASAAGKRSTLCCTASY